MKEINTLAEIKVILFLDVSKREIYGDPVMNKIWYNFSFIIFPAKQNFQN